MKLEPGQLIEVHWTDPTVKSGWVKPKKAAAISAVSYGLVGEVRDDALVIVSGTCSGELQGDVTAIPWGVVKEVWVWESV